MRLEATAETGLYTGRNIAARLDGPQKPRLILTAHYDTVFNSIGAYDNASGVAVLLELANLLKDKHRNLPVEIVLTDSEEWNLMGSRAHAASLSKDDVELAFNVDGIGRGSVLELWSSGEAYERFSRRCAEFVPMSGLFSNGPPRRAAIIRLIQKKGYRHKCSPLMIWRFSIRRRIYAAKPCSAIWFTRFPFWRLCLRHMVFANENAP